VLLSATLDAQGARIEGIRHSQGEYLVFLDSDDQLLPRSIEMRINTLKESEFDAALVYGDVLPWPRQARALGFSYCARLFTSLGNEGTGTRFNGAGYKAYVILYVQQPR
jgi:glycosyltransferase involved in cell wall biosynthesis